MSYSSPVKFSSTNNYGCGPSDEDDVYTVKEFLAYVESGAFIDYDGYGHPVLDKMADREVYIFPSTALKNIPKDATHIVWYNR